jgi:ATP-dependent Clp protease ATP-binding subunit ClpA
MEHKVSANIRFFVGGESTGYITFENTIVLSDLAHETSSSIALFDNIKTNGDFQRVLVSVLLMNRLFVLD